MVKDSVFVFLSRCHDTPIWDSCSVGRMIAFFIGLAEKFGFSCKTLQENSNELFGHPISCSSFAILVGVEFVVF